MQLPNEIFPNVLFLLKFIEVFFQFQQQQLLPAGATKFHNRGRERESALSPPPSQSHATNVFENRAARKSSFSTSFYILIIKIELNNQYLSKNVPLSPRGVTFQGRELHARGTLLLFRLAFFVRGKSVRK